MTLSEKLSEKLSHATMFIVYSLLNLYMDLILTYWCGAVSAMSMFWSN